MESRLKPREVILSLSILIILIPALFLNLGKMPVSGDEGTRALVTLEMEISGNLITPTINGEYYYNKPPLYNYILLLFFRLFDSHSEFIIRLPSVLSLLLYAVAIFLSLYKKFGNKLALISSLSFVTMGRVLYYDSMNGYIDMSFSFLVFIGFILAYKFFQKERFYLLFILTYLIASLGFLMKGIPSLLFQGIMLLVLFISGRKWKQLFSLPHLLGILLLVAILSSYYYRVYRINPEFGYLGQLFEESAKRTFLAYGLFKTFLHIFTFPIEQLYHLFPFSFLFLAFLSGEVRKSIWNDSFLRYFILLFIFNIPFYWIPVESYPRYIFSLYPLLLTLGVAGYLRSDKYSPRLKWIIEFCFIICLFALIPLSFLLPEYYSFKTIENPAIISFVISGTAILAIILKYVFQSNRLEILILTLLVFRVVFNFVVIPERFAEARSPMQKKQAIEVGRIAGKNNLYLADYATCSHETSFYISSVTGKILTRDFAKPSPGRYYIIKDINPVLDSEEIILRFETRWKNTPLRLSWIREP